MKKGRFLWSAHRITEKQKAGKARNIKEKQLKNSRSTASKPPVALRSSPSADRDSKMPKNPGNSTVSGVFSIRGTVESVYQLNKDAAAAEKRRCPFFGSYMERHIFFIRS